MTATLVVGWWEFMRPVALGGATSYAVVTGESMEPTLHEGDLAVMRAAAPYREGDIVTFAVPDGEPGAGMLIIHRIVGGDSAGFTLQGDNRRTPDEWAPAHDEILGSLWVRVPGAGAAIGWVRTPAVLAALLGGLMTTFVLLRRPERPSEDPPDAATP